MNTNNTIPQYAYSQQAHSQQQQPHLLKRLWPFRRLKHLQRTGLIELARVVGGRVALPLPKRVRACALARKTNTCAQRSEVLRLCDGVVRCESDRV